MHQTKQHWTTTLAHTQKNKIRRLMCCSVSPTCSLDISLHFHQHSFNQRLFGSCSCWKFFSTFCAHLCVGWVLTKRITLEWHALMRSHIPYRRILRKIRWPTKNEKFHMQNTMQSKQKRGNLAVIIVHNFDSIMELGNTYCWMLCVCVHLSTVWWVHRAFLDRKLIRIATRIEKWKRI